LLAAAGLALGVSGCEYFTTSSLERATSTTSAPGTQAEADAAADADPLAPPAKLPPPDAPALGPTSTLSAAEIVTLLGRIIQANAQELNELTPQLDDQAEADRARSTFQNLDDELSELKSARKTADAQEAEALSRRIDDLQTPWALARERLNLDLRARMLTIERVNLLNSVLAHDQQRLNAILASGDARRAVEETTLPPPKAEGDATAVPVVPAPAVVEPPKAAVEEPKAATPPTAVPSPIPGVPKADEKKADEKKADEAKTDETKAETDAAKAVTDAPKPPPSKELVAAKRDFQARSTAVQKLQQRTMSLDVRMKNVARSIDVVGELAETSRLCMENATRIRDYLQGVIRRDPNAPELGPWTEPGGDVVAELDRRILACREDARTRAARHDEIVEERDKLIGALSMVGRETQAAAEGLKKAEEQVKALESPFSSHNIREWLRAHGPALLSTLVVMMLLYWIVSRYAHKIVEVFAARGLRGSKAERDNRMETLVSVLQNTGSVVILIGGVLTMFSQAGVPVTPLLGGAAVAGVAVAFGAQNLIKDFFYGFMILLENQYKLKDVVKIGDHAGQVEQITLRMTALRDDEGALHFMPNGSTTSVVNMTHGWSRAAFSLRVPLNEDVDRVVAAIQDLGKEIRQDPALRLMIVDDLKMLGVDELTESAVVLKFFIKTLPLQQWNVKREFLRRLKKKLDQMKAVPPPTSS
jgi:small conductance mechanosensitive channel